MSRLSEQIFIIHTSIYLFIEYFLIFNYFLWHQLKKNPHFLENGYMDAKILIWHFLEWHWLCCTLICSVLILVESWLPWNSVLWFFVVEELITPSLNGLILPGITRKSLLELARDWVIKINLLICYIWLIEMTTLANLLLKIALISKLLYLQMVLEMTQKREKLKNNIVLCALHTRLKRKYFIYSICPIYTSQVSQKKHTKLTLLASCLS